jgi:hypothetical protein
MQYLQALLSSVSKPGAFTAIFKAPRSLFTTNVDNASPSLQQ